ncbi:MAG: hypothetical protein V1904_07310 [Bacteroidota bacterium]
MKADRAGGNVTKIEYSDMDGNEVLIKGKSDCEEIKTFCTSGQIYDLVPLKDSKPDGYKRHMWRKVDGKLKLYDYTDYVTSNYSLGKKDPYQESTVSVERYMIKLNDDKYYDINKKNVTTYIKPFLLLCSDFKDQYKGDFSADKEQFEEMIKLYNLLCN